MAGSFDYLHIKRHTEGSSNELSFDVLDNARSGLDGQKQRKFVFASKKGDLGSYEGISFSAPLSSQPEVAKRKRERRAKGLLLKLVLGMFVLVAALALLWFGYQRYLESQDFSGRFDAIVEQFKPQDEFLAQADVLMSSISEYDSKADYAKEMEKIPVAIEDLNEIRKLADSTKPLAKSEKATIALTQVAQTAQARIEMLQAMQEAFSIAEARAVRIKQGNKIWNDVISAGESAKTAAVNANKASTEDAIKEARDETKSALGELKASTDSLSEWASKKPAVDIKAQLKCLDKKEESLGYALETSDALIDGDRDLAEKKNDAYNKADKESADLAKNLPLSLENTVCKAYEPDLSACIKEYEGQRTKVISADALVRDYLGTSG